MDIPKHWDICSPARQEGEEFTAYRERIKLLKQVEKYYKRGRPIIQAPRERTERPEQGITDN